MTITRKTLAVVQRFFDPNLARQQSKDLVDPVIDRMMVDVDRLMSELNEKYHTGFVNYLPDAEDGLEVLSIFYLMKSLYEERGGKAPVAPIDPVELEHARKRATKQLKNLVVLYSTIGRVLIEKVGDGKISHDNDVEFGMDVEYADFIGHFYTTSKNFEGVLGVRLQLNYEFDDLWGHYNLQHIFLYGNRTISTARFTYEEDRLEDGFKYLAGFIKMAIKEITG